VNDRWSDDFVSVCHAYAGELAADRDITTDRVVSELTPSGLIEYIHSRGPEDFRAFAEACLEDSSNVGSLEECVFGTPLAAVEILTGLWPAAACFVPRTGPTANILAISVRVGLSDGVMLGLEGLAYPRKGDVPETCSLLVIGVYRMAQMLASSGFTGADVVSAT